MKQKLPGAATQKHKSHKPAVHVPRSYETRKTPNSNKHEENTSHSLPPVQARSHVNVDGSDYASAEAFIELGKATLNPFSHMGLQRSAGFSAANRGY